MKDVILLTGEVIQVPDDADASREEAILNFCITDEARKRAVEAHALSKATIMPLTASLDTSGRKSGFLDSVTGASLEVQFREEAEYDNASLEEAEKVMPAKFAELFDRVVSYKPKRRALNQFLASQGTNELENIAREVIRGAMKTEKKEPYIKVRRSKE
ncbi:hypothetical protein C4565_03745 [Candidatus Parcubacteria bacterium]|nr:MAG: hypothetical protein C4565_03745 [Candidatus Parcubacteria bacterium]